jgi:protein O-GlcNAc transferase
MIKIKRKNKKTSKINLHTGNSTLRQSAQICSMGLAFQKRAQVDEAINCYIKSIELNQNNADPYINLGSILQERGQINEAIKNYEKALELRPNDAAANYNLGSVFQKIGQMEKAITFYEKALQVNPNSFTYNNLGILLLKKGRIDEGIVCFQKALQIDPNYANAHNNLGGAFKEKGQLDEAITCCRKAIQLNPNFADGYCNLGLALQEKGKLEVAITYYKKAIEINPNSVDAYSNLGTALKEKGRINDAIACYQKGIQLNPNFAEAYNNLGGALVEKGQFHEAITIYKKAILLDPQDFKARFAKCMSQVPIIYSEHSHIQLCRDHYFDELKKLRDSVSFSTLENINSAADAVGSQQPFYLAYQGLNDREVQHFYGNLICRVMSLRYPQFADRPAMSSHSSEEPLRIGFVSSFFRLHSNWKIPIKGWIENINKKRFSLYGYYAGNKKDEATADARSSFDRFVEDVNSFDELCRIIRKDNLHVLIYPEIGMDPKTVRLATLRLAPIQCTSWGHPDTSGLPTIDYFLSSDLMEPSDADSHYTEKLVRLPNLSIYYTPWDFPPTDITRETFNLRQKSILYLCCQSLFKYLPQYDDIYPRIAKEAGDCQFIFISHTSDYVTEQFQNRIVQSFNKFGLKANNYVVFLPRLETREYNAINSLSNIYLDSIGWSGCNSTFEAIAYDLPIVTLPGELMRGRHSAAILTMMGATDTIASSLDGYIELAIRLGLDSEWRKQISGRIAVNKQLVYRDKTCIAALEEFFERVVKERL